MVAFYSAVLDSAFEPVEMYGRTLHRGRTGDGLELLVCPADLAGVDATNNTIQLRLLPDVDAAHRRALDHGGSSLNEPISDGRRRLAAVRDPDGNSLELGEASDTSGG